jgi:tellurite resistance protein
MHIILGALGSLVTILWLLHRLAEMGIDLGGLNPWAWRRRRKWRSTYEANPVFAITSPMELTALLIAATAKADGDMTSEEKQAILEIFRNDFHLDERDAASLLTASTHLLGRGEEVRDRLADVVRPARGSFTDAQAESAVDMVERIAAVGAGLHPLQSELIGRIRAELLPQPGESGDWN